jgi:tetratricopeptide (TPR) repeat protein
MVVIAAVFLVYWPALRNGFVWDDTALCLRDPLVRSWLNIPEGFRHFLFLDATASNFYRPLQRLTFVFDYQLYAFANPGGWHFTSIAIHAAAAVALFFLVRQLCALQRARVLPEPVRDWLALGVAVLWGIHPLHTSAVTYIAGRADPLVALCGFSALALALYSLQESGRARWATLAATIGFFGVLISKESGGVVLLVWLLILAWRRMPWAVWRKWLAIFIVLLGSYQLLRFNAEKVEPPPPPVTPVAIRPILAARAVAEYTGLIIAPVSLHMERDVSTKPQETMEATQRNARKLEYQTLAGVLLVLGLIAWGRWGRRVDPLIAVALGAALIAYLPISNLISLNATVAEHWLYVPSAFLFLAAGLTLAHSRIPRGAFVAVLVVWMGFLGVRTFVRQDDWRDQRTFIERTIAHGGRSTRMFMNLANVEFSEGHPDRALALYREALDRTPEQAIIWLGYAHVLLRNRDFHAAREALMKASKSPFLAAECLQTTAILQHLETGEDSGSIMREALGKAPRNWPIRKRYLEYLVERGDREEAIRELRDFIDIHDYRNETWRMMGEMLEASGRLALARDAYQQAADRDVHDEKTRARIRALSEAK